MNKKIKHLLLNMIVLILAFFVLLPISIYSLEKEEDDLIAFNENTNFVNSSRYSQKDDTRLAFSYMPIDTSYSTLVSPLGTVYYNEKSLAFMYQNKNGYIWSSYVSDDDKTYPWPNLNDTWEKTAESAITIKYFASMDKSTEEEENLLTNKSTLVTISIQDNKLSAHIVFGQSKIELDLILIFNENSIEVKIPTEGIIEGDVLITTIDVYPFFGAVGNNMNPGYVFIPDGSGALIRYKTSPDASTKKYEKEFYGRDISYSSDSDMNNFKSDGATLSLPVFGFVHGINQNAVFANIKTGSEYAYLNVYPYQKVLYTTVFPTFTYRKKYNQPIDKKGSTIFVLQSEKNSFDIDIEYNFLEDEEANYVGMAKCYREYLEETLGLRKIVKDASSRSILIETIGLEISKGEFFNDRDLMTTLAEYKGIISSLNDSGIVNITGLFNGFTSKGFSWTAPIYNKIASSIGSKNEVQELNELLNRFYLEVDYVMASSKQNGYSNYTDLAKKINMQNYIYGTKDIKNYLLSIDKTLDLFNKSSASLKNYSVDSLAINSLSNMLYSDYQNKTTRTDMINEYSKVLKSDMNIGLYSPNAYLFAGLDDYFDLNLYSSQYVSFDDTVPFIPLVLSSYMNIYSPNANFFSNAKDELLRIIDFNVDLSFIVTSKSSKELADSPLEYIYSSKFDSYKKSINVYYNYVNEALKYVTNALVVERIVLEEGVIMSVYDNGVKIIVNYSNNDYNYLARVVSSKDYEVIK